MAFTSSDLISIEAAIIALSAGSRVEQVAIDGELIKYTPATLSDLIAIRTQITDSVTPPTLRTYAKNGGRGL